MSIGQLVAWCPVPDGDGPLILSVLAHPQNPVTLDSYLEDLSRRIQAMFNLAPEMNREFQEVLEQGGLLAGPISAPKGREAEVLIYSNPNLPERLTNHGLPTNLREMMPTLTLVAWEQLREDRMDPAGRLLTWASAIGTLR